MRVCCLEWWWIYWNFSQKFAYTDVVHHPIVSANLSVPARKRIVYLTRGVSTESSHGTDTTMYMWEGIRSACHALDFNLITIVGHDDLESGELLGYHLPNLQNTDGIIAWTMSNLAPVRQALLGLQQIPMVMLSIPFEHQPLVKVNNESGCYDMTMHLLTVHKYRRIAFIHGQPNHYYALERFQAYEKALRDFGLPIDPLLLPTPRFWNHEAGILAVQELMDDRGLVPGEGFDAIICSSDRTAMGVIEELRRRGYAVPDDVAVTGFNNIPEAQSNRPPISSVSLPFTEQAYTGVNILAQLMAEQPVPAVTELPSTIKTRASCGCSPDFLLSQCEAKTGSSSVHEYMSSIFSVLTNEQADALSNDLIRTFSESLQSANAQAVIDTLQACLYQEGTKTLNLLHWQEVINSLLRHFTRLDTNSQAGMALQIAHIIETLRLFIVDHFFHEQAREHIESQKIAEQMFILDQKLILATNLKDIQSIVAISLPQLGIHHHSLVVFHETVDVTAIKPKLPRKAHYQTSCVDYDVLKPQITNGEFNFLHSIIPPDAFPGKRRDVLIRILSFNKSVFGYLAFESTDSPGELYETICQKLSNAIMRTNLMTGLQKNMSHLKKAQAELLETQNLAALGSLVSGISHELNTPLGVALTTTSFIADQSRLLSESLAGEQVSRSVLQNIGDAIKECTTLLQSNVERGIQLITTLKDLSIRHSPSVHRIFLLPVIEGFMNTRKADFDKPFHYTCTGDPTVVVKADPGKISLVLHHLVRNTLHHGYDQNGNAQIQVTVEKKASKVVVTFADSGKGMQEALLSRIFEPFYTTKRGNTYPGLGLFVVHNTITVGMGGSIKVISSPGHGMKIIMMLPLAGEIPELGV